jgi:RND family efflux transporter MFP subunit
MITRLIAIGLLASIGLFAWAQPGGGPPPVRVAEAKIQEMSAIILVPGTVVSRYDARISADVEGVLLEVADIGTEWQRGQVVAKVRNTILELREPELAAQVNREQAQLEFYDREMERLERLAQQNNAARTQLDQTHADRQMAFSDRSVAEARLAQVRDQIERTRNKAPFDGVVVERFKRPGERVNVGSEILRMVDPGSLEIITRAPLEYLPFVQVGQVVGVSAGGRVDEATVRTIAAVGDENTHVFELRADVSDADYPVGLTVRLTLPASHTREVLAVPRDALVLRASSTAVFVIDQEEVASRVPVTTGLAIGDRIEVQGDIQAGDRVVIRGNERLRPGQKVIIQQDSTAGAANARAPEQ